ncbi:hypothetical protein KUTeg_011640 [Tegillarca granosa]|uniref:Ig-like domain-containing protein n=1 Tax=Tegillarca granosa TaxID=220873 RepID=A0ABQ9F0X3_TEGGR|nr:hypothetical protein KUTeg_011640 [Tegillarca granosa]
MLKLLFSVSFYNIDYESLKCINPSKHSPKKYMCVVSGNATCQACSPRTGPPLPLPPTNSRYVDLGQTVTYTCQGDYGCGDPEDGDVMWYIVKDGDWIDIDSNYRRYNVTQFDREARTIKGANLTIKNVLEEDYSVMFMPSVEHLPMKASVFTEKRQNWRTRKESHDEFLEQQPARIQPGTTTPFAKTGCQCTLSQWRPPRQTAIVTNTYTDPC